MATTLCCCIVVVPEMEAGLIEYFGAMSRVAPAGCFCICCPLESLAGSLSLRIQSMDVPCEVKTKDNMLVRVNVAVQYRVMADRVAYAYYKKKDSKRFDPQSQILSSVYDVIRSSVPGLELNAALASKDDIANRVKSQLASPMEEYGYEITSTVVSDIITNTYTR